MFEQASRSKLRFAYRGQVSVEDLWDLCVEDLDVIYKSLSRQARAFTEDSLLKTVSDARDVAQLKIEIVKHVVKVKLAEAEAQKAEVQNAMRKQQLLSLLAQRQDEQLKELSTKDLERMIEEL